MYIMFVWSLFFNKSQNFNKSCGPFSNAMTTPYFQYNIITHTKEFTLSAHRQSLQLWRQPTSLSTYLLRKCYKYATRLPASIKHHH